VPGAQLCVILSKFGNPLVVYSPVDSSEIKSEDQIRGQNLNVSNLCRFLACLHQFSNGEHCPPLIQPSFINLHGCGISICCGPDDIIVALVCCLNSSLATIKLKTRQLLYIFTEVHRNILPSLVEQDKLDADELLNNYTATNMTSEDEVETVTLPIFQSFQDTFICALMKGHNYEKIWLEPLFAVNSRVPQMCVTMAMIADFLDSSDVPNPHVSVLLRSNLNSPRREDSERLGTRKDGLDIVAASDADFAAAVGQVWSNFVLHCKKKIRQRQGGKEPLSIVVVDAAKHGNVCGVVARECQLRGVLLVIFYQEWRDNDIDTPDLQGHKNSLLVSHSSSTGETPGMSSTLQEVPFENLNGIFRAHIGDVERQLSNAFPPPGSVTEVPHPVLSPVKTPMPPAPRKGRQSRRLKHGQPPRTGVTAGSGAHKSESQLKYSENRPNKETSHVAERMIPLCNLVLPTPEKQPSEHRFAAVLGAEMNTPRPLGN